MLVMFKAKNYMSFKEEFVLDLRATIYKQHPSHTIKINEELSLLKTIAIYGKNASGKSNLVSAMYFFREYIFEQLISKVSSNNDDDIQHIVKFEPFLLNKETSNSSEFEIIFYTNDKTYQYGFECTKTEVLNEWYFIDNKKVFERQKSKVTFGDNYKTILGMYKKIPSKRLYISVLDYFLEEEQRALLIKDFMTFLSKEYNIYFEIILESSVKRIANGVSFSKRLENDKKYLAKVVKYIKSIDIGIDNIEIQSQVVKNKNGEEVTKKVLKTVHNKYGSNGEIVGSIYFDLFQESTGTIRFLSFIQRVIDTVEKGGVFIVDEISARLHPLLTKLIIDIFQSRDNKKAQLIFTTHDISLLNKEQFRRDEIVFIDKDETGVSQLYSLSDLKVREDATFNKDYMQGKYGAIPIFDYNEIFGGE